MIEAVGAFETQTCAAKFIQYILSSIGELRGCSHGILAVFSSTVYFHKRPSPLALFLSCVASLFGQGRGRLFNRGVKFLLLALSLPPFLCLPLFSSEMHVTLRHREQTCVHSQGRRGWDELKK